MKYVIESYEVLGDRFICRNENGEIERLDLFTDSSFPEAYKELETIDERNEYYKTLIGKTIEVESIFPYIPCYFASNVKFIQ